MVVVVSVCVCVGADVAVLERLSVGGSVVCVLACACVMCWNILQYWQDNISRQRFVKCVCALVCASVRYWNILQYWKSISINYL